MNSTAPLPSSALEIELPLDNESLRQVRHQYQQGLLLWLQQKPRDGIYQMVGALEQLMCAQASDDSRSVWWLALGLMDCLLFDTLPHSAELTRLLRQLDQRIASLINQQAVDESALLQDLLATLDQSRAMTSLVLEIKKHFALPLRLEDRPDPELEPVFLEEFAELYPAVEQGLNRLQQQFDPVQWHHIQRHLHTLKGSARMSGLMLTGYVLHEMESQLLLWQQQPQDFDFSGLQTQQQQLSQQLAALKSTPQQHNSDIHFAELYPRLQQLSQQTALELHKQVELEFLGGELSLPATHTAKLVVILEHLLRNAIVHGLELPQQRLAQIKAATGRIVLQLSQPQKNTWQLSVSDDGAGLDLPALQQQAIKQQLLSPNDTPSPNELAQLIFHPGLSTAKQISQLAGRGVGLDVVAHEVQRLGGDITVDTRPKRGCRFIIHWKM